VIDERLHTKPVALCMLRYAAAPKNSTQPCSVDPTASLCTYGGDDKIMTRLTKIFF